MPSITAVDDHLGACYELSDDGELSLIVLDGNGLDAEALGDHRQGRQAPRLPPRRIVVGLFQRAEVSEGPGHSIPVAFVVADTFVGPTDSGSEDVRYVTCHAGLLGDADDQDSME